MREWGEENGTVHMGQGRANVHSSAEQRCPSELLDGPSGMGLQGLPGQHSCRAAQDEGGRAGKWRVLWTVLPRAAPVCSKLEPSEEGGDHPSAECNWPPTKGR